MRSLTENAKSKFGRRRQGQRGALRGCGLGEEWMVVEKGVFGYDVKAKAFGFEMLNPLCSIA